MAEAARDVIKSMECKTPKGFRSEYLLFQSTLGNTRGIIHTSAKYCKSINSKWEWERTFDNESNQNFDEHYNIL